MIKIVWANIVLVCSSLIAVGAGLSNRPHPALGNFLLAAGIASLTAAVLVGIGASYDDVVDVVFALPARGTAWGAGAGALVLVSCIAGYVAATAGLLAACLLVAPLCVGSLVIWPTVHWLSGRPERQRLAAERRRLETEAMEREVGLR